jgi:hypothetical protein
MVATLPGSRESAPKHRPSTDTEPLELISDDGLFTEIPIEDAYVHSEPVEGTLYIPRHIEDDVAKLYFPGFMEFQEATKPVAKEMARRGLIMMTMSPLNKQPKESRFSKKHFDNPWLLQSQVGHALQKAALRQFGIDRFDHLGHSMGNEEALMLAEFETFENTDDGIYIRSVVSDQGLGLDGGNIKRKPLQRIVAAGREVVESAPKLMEHRGEHFNDDAIRHLMAITRIAREGIQCLRQSKAPERIERLRGAGVKVGAVTGQNDHFFRTWAVDLHSRGILDDLREIPGADHLHANAYPAEHADFLKATIAALNERRSKIRVVRSTN